MAVPQTRTMTTIRTLAPAGRASSNACCSTGQAIGRPSEAITRRSTGNVPGSGGGDALRNIAPNLSNTGRRQSPATIGGGSAASACVSCFGSSTLTRYQ